MEKSVSPAARPLFLLPTFNNAATLASVLEGVLAHVPQGGGVVVVNDGCTDASSLVLGAFPNVTVLSHQANKGKGEALLTGFRYAQALGHTHLVSIDTDGQHRPSDLPRFLDAIERAPDAIWLGDRGLVEGGVANAPRSSVFGCKFSNWWVKRETGLALPDTQTGYRAYPLAGIPLASLSTRRFDFEIEILVRASWNGVPLRSLRIDVVYPPAHERVSHFRPWLDNVRLTKVHTRLCTGRILSLLASPFVGSRRLPA